MAAFERIKLLHLRKLLTLHSLEVSLSSNSPLLFAIAFLAKTNRSSLLQLFFKIGVLKTFANFTGKHQCWSLFLLKRDSNTHVKLRHKCEIFKNNVFYSTPLVAASEQIQDISVVHCVEKGEVILWSFSTSLPWLFNIMLSLLTKSSFDISLLFKLKHTAIKLYCGL